MQFGLKLGSKNTSYTKDILSFYQAGYFQYIELFAASNSFDDTIGYWKQFSIPMVIHAPHSFAGMNISLPEERENNKEKLKETFRFADALKSEFIIFHSGVNGDIEETINQLRPFIDSRCLIENKPKKGLNGENCLGSTPDEIRYILNELQTGFCLDFGHGICAANSLKKKPLEVIKEFLTLNPGMYHLTDGDYESEYDTHLHYGKGTIPVEELLKMIPDEAKITNEAKHDVNLNAFKADSLYLMGKLYLRKAVYSDINILYEWANDPETRLFSFNQSLISFDNHKEWFEKKLKSESDLFFIFHQDKKIIGQIRLEINDNTATINYTINPLYRGKGYGYKLLSLVEDKIQRECRIINCFIAKVKYENIASQKIFRKLEYTESDETGLIKFIKNISR